MHSSTFLVVYYSRSGTTQKVAEELARLLKADIEVIRESLNRRGFLGYLRSIFEVRLRCAAKIADPGNGPSRHTVVIVGTPVWAWSVSSPVRAYLEAHKRQLQNVAFFCTQGGSGSDRAFAQMQDIVGTQAQATCTFLARDVASDRYKQPLADFAETLRRLGRQPKAVRKRRPRSKRVERAQHAGSRS